MNVLFLHVHAVIVAAHLLSHCFNLWIQMSLLDFIVRHRKVRWYAAPSYIQTLRRTTNFCYVVQDGWRQHHWEIWEERREAWAMRWDKQRESKTTVPSVLPGWHRGCDEKLSLPPCAVTVMQKSILEVEPLSPIVQVVSCVVQVYVFFADLLALWQKQTCTYKVNGALLHEKRVMYQKRHKTTNPHRNMLCQAQVQIHSFAYILNSNISYIYIKKKKKTRTKKTQRKWKLCVSHHRSISNLPSKPHTDVIFKGDYTQKDLHRHNELPSNNNTSSNLQTCLRAKAQRWTTAERRLG